MKKELTLKNGESSLRFVVSCEDYSDGWCQLYYHSGSEEIKLGANDQKTVFAGLMTGFLSLRNREYFTYSGVEMYTVMNVMDSHAVIAAREADDLLELIFLSTEGEIVPLMSLTDETKTEWVKSIISFLT